MDGEPPLRGISAAGRNRAAGSAGILPCFPCRVKQGRRARKGPAESRRYRIEKENGRSPHGGGVRFCMKHGIEPCWAGKGESRPHVGGGEVFPLALMPCERFFRQWSGAAFRDRLPLSGGLTALPCRRDCARKNPHQVLEIAVPVTGGLPEAWFPVRRAMPRVPPKVPSLPERSWPYPPSFRLGAHQGWREGPHQLWRGPCRRG